MFVEFFVNLSGFQAITSPYRMAEKEDRKRKRSQNIQNAPGSRNLAELRIFFER